MAEKVALDLLVNGAESAQTVKEIKQSLKDIKNEMLAVGENSSEFKKLANAAAQAKDKLEDTQDAIAALNPDSLGRSFVNLGSSIAGGFQAAQGAMVLFGETGEDVQKAMLKVQAATAFAQGIQSVQDLGKAFKAFFLVLSGNPIGLTLTAITALGAGLFALGDYLDSTNSKLDEMTEALKKTEEASKASINAIDLEIIALGGLAANEKTIIELRRQKFKEQIAFAEEQSKIADKAVEEAVTTQTFLEKLLTYTGSISYAATRQSERIIKAVDKQKEKFQEASKLIAELQGFENEQKQKEINEDKKHYADKLLAKVEADKINDEYQEIRIQEQIQEEDDAAARSLQVGIDRGIAEVELEKEINAKKIAEAQKLKDAKLSIEQSLFSGLSSLGQILINDGEKLQKFQKGLALAQLGVDTARALSSALANANSPTPDNVATGGLAGIAKYAGLAAMILANIAKAKQLLSNGGSVPAPTLGGGAGTGFSAPNPIQLNPVSNSSTQINQNAVDQGQGLLKAYVVETEITSTQNNVQQIVNQSIVE